MDLGDLKMFLAVARCGKIGTAALDLHTVQSNVTTRIHALEADLGVRLFHRHPRGVTLTASGRRLLPFAERISDLFVQARRAATDDGTPAGPLVLGSLETTAALRLSPVLAEFAAAYPLVDLSLTTGTTSDLIEDVLARRLDGAFVVGPVRHPELEEETIFREELVIVTGASIRTLEELHHHRSLKIVVFRAGCTYRKRLETLLAARGLVGIRQLEFGTLGGIVACVAAGIGITLLPRAVISSELREGRIAAHELSSADERVETVFIQRKDSFVSSAMAAFLRTARPHPMRLVANAD